MIFAAQFMSEKCGGQFHRTIYGGNNTFLILISMQFFKKEKVSGNFIKRATTLDGNLKKKTEDKSGSLNQGP